MKHWFGRFGIGGKIGPSTRITALGIAMVFALAGCQSSAPPEYDPMAEKAINAAKESQSEPVLLREGDEVTIQFPGAPNLNTTQQIKLDGKITLSLGMGDIVAAGKTVGELEKDIIRIYGDQLVSKLVTVTVKSSTFTVYVSGAVLKQGKISSDRPLTALQAVMEAGVDYSRANLSKVKVVRTANGLTDYTVIDLSRVLKGQVAKPYYLKQGDIIYVPEKFVWL